MTHTRKGAAAASAGEKKAKEKKEQLRHEFELQRIVAIFKEKERKVLTRMQSEHEAGLERSLSAAAAAIELEERSKIMRRAPPQHSK